MTVDQLSAHLKVAKSTLYKPAQEGWAPDHQVGKHRRFRMDAIDAWLEEPLSGRGTPGHPKATRR